MPRIKHHRSSRRVPPPKDSDFDHEISLVDHTASSTENLTEDGDSLRLPSQGTNSAAGPARGNSPAPNAEANNGTDMIRICREVHTNGSKGSDDTSGQPSRSSVQIEPPTPGVETSQLKATERRKVKAVPQTPETAIDVLYENQRGGFLCGMALFSSKALGNLDPAPWTNSYHKTSPTDITNAQVPDPSWEWVWPEWRINRDDGVDEEGWQYSFMFSKKFSWHKASWWNSFVRRRAWIRQRAKKTDKPYSHEAGSMLSPEYFSVRPSSEIDRTPSRQHSRAPSKGSMRNSRLSMSTMADERTQEEIDTVEALLDALRRARIDREKTEAVESYLRNSSEEELEGLQDFMHEIIAMFVFQASRRVLLTKLTDVYDKTVEKRDKLEESEKGDTGPKPTEDDGEGQEAELAKLRKRADNLSKAIQHADEEVRRLEYWSDVKGMAQKGESKGAVDQSQGWNPSWQGVDKSGPSHPPPPKEVDDTTGDQ